MTHDSLGRYALVCVVIASLALSVGTVAATSGADRIAQMDDNETMTEDDSMDDGSMNDSEMTTEDGSMSDDSMDDETMTEDGSMREEDTTDEGSMAEETVNDDSMEDTESTAAGAMDDDSMETGGGGVSGTTLGLVAGAVALIGGVGYLVLRD